MAKRIELGAYIRDANDQPGVLEQLSERLLSKSTTDYLERKLDGLLPVFVYGSLRKGFHNHHYVEGLPYLGEASTTIEKYEMREAGGSSFPVVFERPLKMGKRRNPVSGRIKGEVYVADPRALLAMDRLENNGGMYTRSQQWIFLDQQKSHKDAKFHPSIKCWMYMGNEMFWQGRGATETCHSYMKSGQKFYDWSDAFASLPETYGYLAQ